MKIIKSILMCVTLVVCFVSCVYLHYLYDHSTRTYEKNVPSFHANIQKLYQELIVPSPVVSFTPCQNISCVNVNPLLEKLADTWHWAFIKKRISSHWEDISDAQQLLLQKGLIPDQRKVRHVLVFPGLILETHFARQAFSGAPLGELVQWSDLIAGLHVLGHNVHLEYDGKKVQKRLETELTNEESSNGCASDNIDYIYTDLSGHLSFSDRIKQAYQSKFRILDNFGTEQMYNNIKYTRRTGGYEKSKPWGSRNLHLKQFYTYYPVTPDNSFLGFTISNHSVKANGVHKERKNISYIYLKDPSMIRNKKEASYIIPILRKYTEIHVSLPRLPGELFPYRDILINHGIMDSSKFLELAMQTKLVIGLGAPVEGPGVLEAISRGCVFINPKIGERYRNKPTNRILTSQNPYAEKFIGPPYVYTVDYSNTTQLEAVIQQAISSKVEPFIPFELTTPGYLQRLHSFLEHQNFCENSPLWPPIESLQVQIGQHSMSCNEICESKGLVCENIYFPSINNILTFNKHGINCTSTASVEELYAPAFIQHKSACVLQQDHELFSCASYMDPNDNEVQRLCPCRDYIKHQIQLCSKCV